MKLKQIVITGFVILFTGMFAQAQTAVQIGNGKSTVTTTCGNTYEINSTNVRVSSSSTNGETQVTIYVDGSVYLRESCQSGSGEVTSPETENGNEGGHEDYFETLLRRIREMFRHFNFW